MTKRTFFVALGVPRGSAPEAVRLAYRRILARYRRQLDPEFDEPTEPNLRFAVMRSYCERRHSALFEEPQPEPLIPPSRTATAIDRFYGGWVPEVAAPARARPEGKDLYVELRLDYAEAQRGGLFPVHIPVLRPCPHCAEREQHDRLSCQLCRGTGQVLEDRMVEVTTPPGVQHGQIARLAMEDVGLEDTDLIVQVMVTVR